MSRRNVYFLSDIHLGASYIADTHAHQRRVVDFLRSIEEDAATVYLLGDILDYWFEYRTVVPRGYVRFFGQLARMADMGIEIIWFTGNHDIWLFDYLRDEIGLKVVDASGGGVWQTIGNRLFFLGHGDDFGRQPRTYKLLRAMFHNRLLQKMYSGIHPRWTIPFAHGWSSHSRKGSASESDSPAAAIEAAEAEAARLAAVNPNLRYVIIGHLHVALDVDVSSNCRLVVLGDWITGSTYAVFDGDNLRLKEFLTDV